MGYLDLEYLDACMVGISLGGVETFQQEAFLSPARGFYEHLISNLCVWCSWCM
jgi:hypothetical protein